MIGPAPAQASDTAARLRADPPRLVLASSFAYGAMVAAEAARVPFDVLFPNAYPLPAPGMPPCGAGLKPARGAPGRLRDLLVGSGAVRMFDHYALKPLNRLRAMYGLEPLDTSWEQPGRARQHLILTSASFDFPATLPQHASYVGPVTDDPAWARAESWSEPAGEGPLVLVAMSSTFQNQAGCLQRIADVLGTLPVRGLITTGPRIGVGELDPPDNVGVVATAPHSAVLRSADLVITHGGHGTVIKSLAAGLPLLILHHGRDQADNAVRVTTRGAGISVPRTAKPARIARAVNTLLHDPAYAVAARELGARIARVALDDGPLLAALER